MNSEIVNLLGDRAAALFAGDHCAEVRWRVLRNQNRHSLNVIQALVFIFVSKRTRIDAARAQMQVFNREAEHLIDELSSACDEIAVCVVGHNRVGDSLGTVCWQSAYAPRPVR
ncbi:MAG: hypothetical protein ACREQO_07680 [Candidatus Binatia bacterium]